MNKGREEGLPEAVEGVGVCLEHGEGVSGTEAPDAHHTLRAGLTGRQEGRTAVQAEARHLQQADCSYNTTATTLQLQHTLVRKDELLSRLRHDTYNRQTAATTPQLQHYSYNTHWSGGTNGCPG